MVAINDLRELGPAAGELRTTATCDPQKGDLGLHGQGHRAAVLDRSRPIVLSCATAGLVEDRERSIRRSLVGLRISPSSPPARNIVAHRPAGGLREVGR